MAIIYLHNPAHNGDVLFSCEIVKVFVRSNPNVQFKIVPSCSSILFRDVVSDKVSICEHPILWNMNHNTTLHSTMIETDIKPICNLPDTLLSYEIIDNIGRLYINTWQLLILHSHCMDLRCKPSQIAQMLQFIKDKYKIKLEFNCNDYRELIPQLPDITIDTTRIFTRSLEGNIFFYNLDGFSGQDAHRYSSSFNNNVIKHLLVTNPNKRVIVVNKTDISHPNLVTLSTDVGIEKTICGINLLYYAKIARLCDSVYFKLNGGSLYVLNKENIEDTSTQYYLFDDNDNRDDSYSKIITSVYNNRIIIVNDYGKFN
jgi:hypothetical protein